MINQSIHICSSSDVSHYKLDVLINTYLLLRPDEYISNDVITPYYSDYAILYPAEGTKQVKTLFINR